MIPEKYTYLFVDFFTIIFPLIFSFTKAFDFRNYWKHFFPSNIIIALIFILWDIYYTSIGVWGFDLKYTLGIQVFNLPIEEILFFICTPYACVFTYYCFRKFIFPKINFSLNILWIIFSILFLLVGFYQYEKSYTSAAFISCAISLFVAYTFSKINFLHFAIFYFIILIPFYIFNGILTGSFLHRVVVFYNDYENLGLRVMTVPFEDIFYGMGLLLLNIVGFEYSLNKKNT